MLFFVTIADLKRLRSQHAQRRRRIVTVVGSGKDEDVTSNRARRDCADVGALVARLGFDLLTGAGAGVMRSVSASFFETRPRDGVVIGIVPGEIDDLKDMEVQKGGTVKYEVKTAYPNEWVETAIYTHLPDSGAHGTLRSSRNHINILTGDAVIALPGGKGTEKEVWLAVQYGIPIRAFGEHPASGPPHGITLAGHIEQLREFLLAAAPRAR
jgi:predicted Rossmann-fold nucleotide-binding protein